MTALDLTNETAEDGSLVAQFVSLRERLIERRGTLTTELREIDAALGVEDNGVFLTEGAIRIRTGDSKTLTSDLPEPAVNAFLRDRAVARGDTDITELRPESMLPKPRSRRTHDDMVALETKIRAWLIHWKEPRSAFEVADAINEDRDAVAYSMRRMVDRNELTTTGARRSLKYLLAPQIATEMAVAAPDDDEAAMQALEAVS